MKNVNVEITGVSPLLMHAFPLVYIEALEKRPPEEQAEFAAYRIPVANGKRGNLCIPSVALQRALVSGATYSKGKGRGNLSRSVGACVLVTPAYLDLGVANYELDARPVVIPATKGRVVRYRPRVDTWKVSCNIEWDEILLTEGQLRKVVDDTGSRVGVLDFRPEKRGPFGRFMVTSWQQ